MAWIDVGHVGVGNQKNDWIDYKYIASPNHKHNSYANYGHINQKKDYNTEIHQNDPYFILPHIDNLHSIY